MTGIERAIYLFCDTGRSLREIMEYAATTSGGCPPNEPAIERTLNTWLDAG